jgi:hypothetical protein
MTPAGLKAFEQARRELGKLYAAVTGRTIAQVSDGDTVEFLARGAEETRKYLAETLIARGVGCRRSAWQRRVG